MNNSKRGFILVIILSVILVLIIGVGTIKEKRDNKKNDEEYARYIEETDNKAKGEEAKNDTEQVDSSKVKGFVNKLKTKQDVKVLILGDDMAMSIGRTSDSGIWSGGVKNLIETTYGSKTDLTLIAKEGATTETGLNATKENDISGFDLVILCYGNNDAKVSKKVSDVKDNYTEIVKNVRLKSQEALVITVLESSLELNSPYRLAVAEVATNNSLIKADMREAFNSSGKKESSLSKNGFPNDTGYQLYTQTIGNKIKEAID